MLPTSSSAKGRSGPNARPNLLPQYLRRIVKWQQMDIEYTFWQMFNLCKSPKVVYQHTKYHKRKSTSVFHLFGSICVSGKALRISNMPIEAVVFFLRGSKFVLVKETKNQWARDDPAFIVIFSLLLAVTTMAYCAAYDHSVGHAVFVVVSVLLFHFLVPGAILATCCW
ncbi:hypothetical protein BUALT_Bualt19G0106700 [Buddleja alternifolia]|uniref:Uncharacterized protein n=1 Tax=Buddleja alternifolia TaxID=168488 RepID=A0AAV6W8P5_9LAMI|nr:hypothetical protein BUALT_Bualt19G0106700 [Buddleja alternifolia]